MERPKDNDESKWSSIRITREAKEQLDAIATYHSRRLRALRTVGPQLEYLIQQEYERIEPDLKDGGE